MRPYIFLDCDGVVNGYLRSNSSTEHQEYWKKIYVTYPECIQALQDLCSEVNPVIVVSSTWRITLTRDEFVNHIGEWILDYLAEGDDWETPGGGGKRGPQIQNWLDSHEPRPFVVLDDESSDIHADQPMVKTSMMAGLQPYDVKRAIALLKLQGWKSD